MSVESYLSRHGWIGDAPGQMGALWSTERSASKIAVPHNVGFGSFEFRSVISRIAIFEGRSPDEVAHDVETEFSDVFLFRIPGSVLHEESAALAGAITLLTQARRLYRAASTSARTPKAHIGSGFSRRADEIAGRVRLEHTRRGSYVLPVKLDVHPVAIDPNELPVSGTERVGPEPEERRVTRMLAGALTSLNSLVVEPERIPNTRALMDLVHLGVSRELVLATIAIATAPGLGTFDVSFNWAGSVDPPGGVSTRVVITDEASRVLESVAEKLKFVAVDPDQSISGQISEVRYVEGEPRGSVAIRTVRNSRLVEVRALISPETADQAHVWASQHRAVLLVGIVQRQYGRLVMESPQLVRPLDDILLDENPTTRWSRSARPKETGSK